MSGPLPCETVQRQLPRQLRRVGIHFPPVYFVDAPETSMEFRDRLQEQASYFGVTIDQVMQVRELAKRAAR